MQLSVARSTLRDFKSLKSKIDNTKAFVVKKAVHKPSRTAFRRLPLKDHAEVQEPQLFRGAEEADETL